MLKWARSSLREGLMAEIVAAALTAHAPLITGKPEVSRPEQRDRLYAGFDELRPRLAAARPDPTCRETGSSRARNSAPGSILASTSSAGDSPLRVPISS